MVNGDKDNPASISNSSESNNLAASSCVLPWTPLEGEDLVNQDTYFSEVYCQTHSNEKIKGNIFITNFRVYFNSDVNEQVLVVDIPLGFIHRVEKLYNNQINEFAGILVYCKNGRKFNILKTENDKNFEQYVYNYLVRYSFPLSNGLNFFAFSYKPKLENNNGWYVYDPEKEYKRMGVNETSKWFVCKFNSEFKLCDSYPRHLVVPRFVDEKTLELIAQFRSRARFPVLSWLSPNAVPLLRSAQPLCGMLNRRNYYDENYLKDIADMCSSQWHAASASSSTSTSPSVASTPSSSSSCNLPSSSTPLKQMYILDARPFKNALANYTAGGGYENEKYYTSCKLVFMNIENIHAMRDSLGATTCGSNEQFLMSTLENSKWLEHIRLILDGALLALDKIVAGHPVLVHCSDGWDRTAQLTSISMVLLDKYYRTIEGFEVLIEKEWVSFGHRFGTRMGHGSDKHSDSDRSPIFIQFIDCVWQIMQDQPRAFEFNEKLLLIILHHIYTCQYGTFLLDSEFEREKCGLKSRTVSLWSYVNSNLNEYLNSEYMEYDRPIQISTNRCKLWKAYYFRQRNGDMTACDNENGDIGFGSINNGDLSTLDRSSADKNLEPFGTLLDNLFSNSYRLFSRILEKN